MYKNIGLFVEYRFLFRKDSFKIIENFIHTDGKRTRKMVKETCKERKRVFLYVACV